MGSGSASMERTGTSRSGLSPADAARYWQLIRRHVEDAVPLVAAARQPSPADRLREPQVG
jgi:hypothetical protein